MLNVIILNVVMLNVIKLGVVMMIAVMLIVVAPLALALGTKKVSLKDLISHPTKDLMQDSCVYQP
jgi:hypothetical protein